MSATQNATPSRRQRVAQVVLDLTWRLGVAVHLTEVEAELRARFPGDAPFNVALVLAQLCTSGVLHLVFGRPPHGRYAHRDHLIDAVPPDEPMAAAAAVVQRHWNATGLEMPTADATNAMRAVGVDLPDPRSYRVLLDALTRPSTRGAPSWRAPRLVARSVTTLDGRTRTLWRPAGTAEPDSRAAVSQTDLAMEAVARTEAALGRPVSRAEVALWVAAHAETDAIAARIAAVGGLGRALDQLGEARVGRLVHGKGEWAVVRTLFTVVGGPPERYTVRPRTPTVAATVDLEDRLLTYRPADELESLDAAWILGARLDYSPVADVVLHRAASLAMLLRPKWSEGQHADAVALIARANGTLTAWANGFGVNARGGKLAPLLALRRHLDALQRVRPEDYDGREDRLVGAAATATHHDLLPYVASAPRLLGREYASEESLRMFYDSARRVPNRDARWERNAATGSLVPADREGLGWMLVDRVDALSAIWDAVSPPRATSLLAPARALLGHVLRDTRPLEALLAGVPAARGDIRRPVVLALALLGAPVAYEVAVPRADDEVDTAAYLLACVVANPDRRRLTDAVAQVAGRATSREARRTASEADRMLGTGLLLSVVG